MVRIGLIKKFEAFQGFSEDQLSRIQPFCEMLSFQKDAKLFTEGNPAEHLWLVVEGAVDLRFELPDNRPTAEEHTISSVKVGKRGQVAQTFGWSCFVPPYKMRLSAYCVADNTSIVRVAKSALIKEFEKDPQMGYAFLTYLITVVGYRFHQFQDEIAKIRGTYIMAGW
jgi:CRP-like cAMP-binding protein